MSWDKVIQLSEKGQFKQQLLALFAWLFFQDDIIPFLNLFLKVTTIEKSCLRVWTGHPFTPCLTNKILALWSKQIQMLIRIIWLFFNADLTSSGIFMAKRARTNWVENRCQLLNTNWTENKINNKPCKLFIHLPKWVMIG